MSENMRNLAVKSNGKRGDMSRLKADIRAGRVDIAVVLMQRPECVSHLLVLDVIRMARGGYEWQRRLGNRMNREDINLLVRMEVASERTLRWAAENAPKPVRRASPGVSSITRGDSCAHASGDAELQVAA